MLGIGLRYPHMQEILSVKPKLDWLEVHSENFFADDKSLCDLEKIREHYPISCHGVGLSLGSTDKLNIAYLKQLKSLQDRINPLHISDHFSWSSLQDKYYHDLLPLPLTQETILHIVPRIQTVQEFLGRPLLIENVTRYVNIPQSSLTEGEVLIEIAQRTGCGILLDLTNVYVSATHQNFNPVNFILNIPKAYIRQIHLAGYTQSTVNGNPVLLDTHGENVNEAIYQLYRTVKHHLANVPIIIERDNNIPPLATLCAEVNKIASVVTTHA